MREHALSAAVVNAGGYIGEQTGREIEYARQHGKEILYHAKPGK